MKAIAELQRYKNVTRLFVATLVSVVLGLLSIPLAHSAELIEPPMPVVEGGKGDAASNKGHAISGDGRFLTFTSFATNHVAGDGNGVRDVFLWDSLLNTIDLISIGVNGEQSNGDSSDAVISADGNWIAFSSTADNLTHDTNGSIADVFLYNRVNQLLTLVSKSSAGVQSQTGAVRPDINANGRYVTFDTMGDLAAGAGSVQNHVFRRDLWNGRTELVSQSPAGVAGNGLSSDAQMSADGQSIVFVSMATNLVSAATVGKDSYLRDMNANSVTLLSLNASGEAGDGASYFPSISGNGKVAAFHTNASNLVAGSSPNFADVVLLDISTGEHELLSGGINGAAANNFNIHPSLSYDGQRVLFSTNASNLVAGDAEAHVDVVLIERSSSTLSLLSQGLNTETANGDSGAPSISFDGRHAAFESLASNLSPNGSVFSDVLLARLEDEDTAEVSVLAAVLPSSRSVQLGESLTVFASVLSPGIANSCRVGLDASSAAGSAELSFQTTDPLTNVVVGGPDQSFLLLPDVPQSLLLTITPDVEASAEEMTFEFVCSEGIASAIPGINTLLVSAETTAAADVVALVATVQSDGVVWLPQGGGAGFFSVASVNLGASAEMTVQPVVLGAALDGISICQTNPVTGVCLAEASSSVAVNIDGEDTPTFAVFISNSTDVSFAPANNRVVVQFMDGSGIVRGRTSVAVASR